MMAETKRAGMTNEYVYGTAVRKGSPGYRAAPAPRTASQPAAAPGPERGSEQKPIKRGNPNTRQAPSRQGQGRSAKSQADRKKRVRRNQKNALRMDLPYVIMLTVASVVAMGICLSYLQVQIAVSSSASRIQSWEQKLEALRTENDALENRININIDLDEVYRIATEELGMVYANKNQVILYDKTENEYVRQNEDIPQY